MIYADNAATTKLDKDAFDIMCRFLTESFGNPSQPYTFSYNVKKALEEAREKIACCIGAEPQEIYFTSGGTESDNWAIKCGAGDSGEIVTSVIEHHAVLNSCRHMEKIGHSVKYLPVSDEGVVRKEDLEKLITSETRLISVMLANNEIGSIQPVKKLAQIAHKRGILFHTDAVQAAGHVPVNVRELDVDMLSASAHKFNGPKGIGFLYIRKGTNIEPYLEGGGQERGFRAGTENVAAIAAMACALEKNCYTMVENMDHLKNLENIVVEGLKEKGIEFKRNGSNNRIPGNISLSFAEAEGEMLLQRLDLKGICVSTGSACDGMNTQISHVIKAIHVPEDYAEGTIRISFGKGNTEEEAESVVHALTDVLKK